MFIFDIFKDESGRLQAVTVVVAAGMLTLLGGLWWVQIVLARKFEQTSRDNAIRHVHTPAIRGRILDRNGQVLAEEQPRYNAILYLEELQPQFGQQYLSLCQNYVHTHPEVITAKGKTNLSSSLRQQLHYEADCDVVSNVTYRLSASLAEPRLLNTNAFLRHYRDHPFVPFQIVPDLTPKQVAILAEQWQGQSAVDLETQPVRVYRHHALAANLLGYVQRRNNSDAGEFSFDMPHYEGTSGVESVYEEVLRGQAGENSVLIDNMNYRQRQEVETPDEPGNDLYLTIDLSLQKAAEKALAAAPYGGPVIRGAAIIMDPRNGDILAMASAPSFDPNYIVLGQPDKIEHLNDPKLKPQFNRAVTGAYPPGSTFKIITAIACLEDGLDPNEVFDSPGEYRATPRSRPIGDEAGKGKYDLVRAFYRSSNTYFIVKGKDRLSKILEVAKRFHLGEKTGISTRREAAGDVPEPDMVGPSLGMSAADICIGQEITASPLQLAGMVSVIANGGTLYVPRVVSYAKSPESGEIQQLVPQGQVRDHVQIDPRHLALIRHAMLEDTEHAPDSMGPGGTAYASFHSGGAPKLGGFRVAGKTGTAEVKSPGSPYRRVTWFDSYGPFEDPRYVVLVMVEDGSFGGNTCAPVAEEIYEAILKREQPTPKRTPTLAHN
jgi:penicillin-binding protein 2